MQTHNFRVVGGDTDSIMFCKQDQSPFSEEEQESLLEEINSLLPTDIKFEADGTFKRVVYLKAKNYIMVDEDGKRTVKGSSLKSSTLEPVLKEMLKEFISLIIDAADNTKLVEVYTKYIQMVYDIKDITPFAKKMQLSPTTFNSTRTNETSVVAAIQGSEYKSGDKIWVYRTPEGALKLAERFVGDYDRHTYYEKIFKTTKRFETILPVKELFPNYSLKRNKKILDVLNGVVQV